MARPLRSTSGVVSSRFVEHPVAAPLAGAAACTWEGRPGAARSLRVLPDGCVDLTWDGERLRAAGAEARAVRHDVVAPAVGLRLQAGAAGRVLGAPAHLVPGEGVELGALWASSADRWERRLRDAADAGAARLVLEALVVDRLGRVGGPDQTVRAAVSLLGAGRALDDVAARVGLSGRELRRRFRRDVGVGPKALQRVLRFRGFLASLDDVSAGRRPLAVVAASLGYVDQAHLARECRALSGSTPTGLARRWARHEPGQNVQDVQAAESAPSSA